MIVVQKYGGSSLADTKKILNVSKKIKKRIENGDKLVVIVSAMGKTTDNLINLAKSLSNNPPLREMDMLLTTGEQISVALLSIALNEMGIKSKSFNAFQLNIRTTEQHTKARIKDIDKQKILEELKENSVIIVTGFQGISDKGDLTTLGRGGSDTSAVAVAAKLGVNCEIYSDVDGIYACDPKIIKGAKKIEFITYDDALELSSLGAKVLHSRAVELAKKYKVKIYCASSFVDKEGTWVVEKIPEWLEQPVVTGTTIENDQTKITINELPKNEMLLESIFEELSKKNINIDMISMYSDYNHFHLSFTVLNALKDHIIDIIKSINSSLNVTYQGPFDKVSVVGVGMKSSTGVAARFFKTIANLGIKPEVVTTSEIKISVLVPKNISKKLLKNLADEFNLRR
ncbi:aspartate kinase [Thermosipho melanesiensis]|uniref:Aspartokinase n=2 Tax=Thermosipho melanesiensis TaxID=46541 RepID=A6LP61_THEM4|nr:aspartate kinase [Thermosipho melanesiensis]ABR31712.1 aspartate kinase [Thermosipho melanesiensis BI429]APT74735.1 aspartate kinase [Thermosipho melanesiensis]OOC35236.1 aspartate kinase [Thermosipho melanesiensis]OOC35446.1 aspartate kinase [Thermosipho melanesiensis]OOC36697.1 aspartate kinase [Thermosipho melanesiensis]